MADSRFPLIPASILAEDATDSLAALVKQAKAAPDKTKSSGKAPAPASRKSMALSQLAKAFKGKDKSSASPPAPGEPKSDSGLKKAAAAIDKPKPSGIDPGERKVNIGGGGHRSAAQSDKTGAAAPAAMSKPSSLPLFKDPHMDVEHPPSKHEAFHHDSPSLKERTRPDVIPFDERHQDFHDRYHAEDAKVKKIKYLGTSSGHVFHGEMDDDTQYIMKPHKHPWAEGGNQEGIQPDQWEKRHNATARLLSHMGADHMMSPAVDTKGHSSDMLPWDHPVPGRAGDRSAHSHAGQRAFATEFIQGAVDGQKAAEISHKVDQEHRLMGLITHMVTVNSDGHAGNVMVNKEHGHPILIDSDLTGALGMERGGVRSSFLPGGVYDYRMGDESHKVGHNYPPRVKKTLEWLAGGGHRHAETGLDVHDDDKDAYQMMAKHMVKYGLEGAMEKLEEKGVQFSPHGLW